MFMPPYGGVNFPYKTNLNWIIEQIKKLLTTTGSLEQAWEEFQKAFGADLDQTVKNQLTEWLNDGTLAGLINQLAVLLPWVSVTTYGATGDGVTDDTLAFQNAIEDSKWIYVPDGNYNITSLTLKDGTVIFGESKNAVLYQSSLVNSNLIRLANNNILNGLTINANGQGKRGEIAGVYAHTVQNIVITNCLLINGLQWNLYMNTCTNVLISNCEMSGCINGASCTIAGRSYGNTIIDKCYMHNNGLDGIVAGQVGIRIVNCTSNNNGLTIKGTSACGVFVNEYADNACIENNIFDGNGYAGVEVAGNAENVRILNNIVQNNLQDGIEIRQNLRCFVVGNYLYNNTSTQFGGQISYSVTAGSYYSIIDNNIIDCNNVSDYGVYAPKASNCYGTNIIINAKSKDIYTSDVSSLSSASGDRYAFIKRLYFRFTDSRAANIVNAGNSNYIQIAGNQDFQLARTSGGFARLFCKSHMETKAIDDPMNGDFYCDASGVHIYYNGWKTIAYN